MDSGRRVVVQRFGGNRPGRVFRVVSRRSCSKRSAGVWSTKSAKGRETREEPDSCLSRGFASFVFQTVRRGLERETREEPDGQCSFAWFRVVRVPNGPQGFGARNPRKGAKPAKSSMSGCPFVSFVWFHIVRVPNDMHDRKPQPTLGIHRGNERTTPLPLLPPPLPAPSTGTLPRSPQSCPPRRAIPRCAPPAPADGRAPRPAGPTR